MHQDRDEAPETLAAGLPVVSLSVGDSAEFYFSEHSAEDMTTKARRASGVHASHACERSRLLSLSRNATKHPETPRNARTRGNRSC